MDGQWRIELLGGLRARHGDRLVSRFQTRKTGSLLAYLAFYIHRRHSREELVDLFWPDGDPEAGRTSLRVALTSLRHQLEPPGVPPATVIVADRALVGLNPAAVTTDVLEFEEALGAAAQYGARLRAPMASDAEKVERLEAAVALYRDDLLPDQYDDWILPEQRRLADLYYQALRDLAGEHERAGRLSAALTCARRAVGADPLREDARRELMRLLAAAGQPAAALEQYRELERVLTQELGRTPGTLTRHLAAEIERGTAATPHPPHTSHTSHTSHPPHTPLPPHTHTSHTAHTPHTSPPRPGTVTFLLTDIEGSTANWGETGDAYRATLASHHELLRREFQRHGGYEVSESGDGFVVAFSRAADALACAVAAQRAVEAAKSPAGRPPGPSSFLLPASVSVRIALHTGDVEWEGGECRSLALHRASRLVRAAHGGQILCSEATAALLRWGGLEGQDSAVRLADLGHYRLRDVPQPERLHQVEYFNMPRRRFPPPNAEAGYATHLPLSLTRFFGREDELAALAAMLAPDGCWVSGIGCPDPKPETQHPTPETQHPRPSTRLVTLTGAGGCGKTRLALEVARRLVEAFRAAVWFAPLGETAAPQEIPAVVLEAMREPRRSELDPLEQAMEALSRHARAPSGPEPALLVLDNFEHLVEEGAGVVRQFLEAAPALTCLVTSRSILELDGEREFLVPPLPVPAQGIRSWVLGVGKGQAGPNTQNLTPNSLIAYPSVQLFVDRAQAVRPDFQVTKANVDAVAELCARLEGLPLAIELAAARAQLLTPAQMLEQLGPRGEPGLDFLASHRRGGVSRHRTLRAAIDWSYQSLPRELQRFFAWLSVFRDGATVEAAQAVCEEPLALLYLEQLRERSLIMAEGLSGARGVPGPAGTAGVGFRMLETLRAFGREQLSPTESATVERRHAAYYLALAEESLAGGDPDLCFDRLEAAHENLRAALAWSLAAVEGGEWRVGGPDRSEPQTPNPRHPIPNARHEVALRLVAALGPFWEQRGYWSEGREWASRALAASADAAPAHRAAALAISRRLAILQNDDQAARRQ
jgi:predicted ATPase/DNA-binding SARP family transcriptional activator/class 3 adenylate cyclase